MGKNHAFVTISGMRLFLFFLFSSSMVWADPISLSLNAEQAILINGKTGAIIVNKEAFTPTYPASTTKIATALYALEKKGEMLDEIVTVKKEALATISPQAKRDSNYRSPPHWLESDGSHVGLKKGEELSLHNLLRAVLISSANDASNTVAIHVGESVPKFMEQLNLYLKSIGCLNTSFNNPHGLHHPNHKTTAYDLALMAKKALEIPTFREIVGTTRYTCPQTNLEKERTFIQTNLLLRSGSYHYSRAIGVKTGGTQAAGKNLVAAAVEDDRMLIGVVLGCKSRSEVYQDMIKMFDAAFKEPKMRRTLLQEGEQKMTCKVKGGQGKLKTSLSNPLYYDFYPSEEQKVKVVLEWTLPRLPIKKGAQVGALSVVDEQKNVLQKVPLYAAQEMRAVIWMWVLFGVGALLLLLIVVWRLIS